MPFVNGKYYMNPQYGVAIENARLKGAFAPGEQAVSLGRMQVVGGQKATQQTKPQQPHSPEQNHFSGDATYYDLPGSKTASGRPSILTVCLQR